MDLSKLPEALRGSPHAAVVTYAGGRLTRLSYPALHERVEAAARRLRSVGVEPGVRVGLMAENGVPWVVHDLALLKLGAVNVALPADEFAADAIEGVCAEYRLNLLLTTARGGRGLAPAPWVLRIDAEPPASARLRHWREPSDAKTRREPALDPDVFSIVFSSGTSGKLKALAISKRGTEVLIETLGRLLAFRPDDAILAFLPLANFQQRWMLYCAVAYQFDFQLVAPPLLFRAFAEMKPTVFGGPPLFYETLENRYRNLAAPVRRRREVAARIVRRLPGRRLRRALLRRLFPSLHAALGGRPRILLVGSAPSRRSTLELFNLLELPLYEGYGLTETGYLALNREGANRIGSVGQPIAPGIVELADDGEVIARLESPLSLGYLNVDAAEARRTYLAPGRIATGDIGRFDADGYLHLTGRKKEILITQGGYKVHPEMLEHPIGELAEVAHAVVFGGGEIPGLALLVALRGPDTPKARHRVESAVDALNGRVAAAARIGRVVYTCEELRADNGLLTRNLKVDRRAVWARFGSQILGTAGAAR